MMLTSPSPDTFAAPAPAPAPPLPPFQSQPQPSFTSHPSKPVPSVTFPSTSFRSVPRTPPASLTPDPDDTASSDDQSYNPLSSHAHRCPRNVHHAPPRRQARIFAAQLLGPRPFCQDLCLLYAFFRTADDLVDDAPTPEQCSENLVTIRRFLRDVFSPAKASDNPTLDTLPSHINWYQYAELLPNEEVLVIFKNFARIAHYLCSRAMFELTDAWELDLLGKPVKKQNDLLDYAALISGTFGELCTCAIMYKTGHGNWGKQLDNAARDEDVLSRARATGQVCLNFKLFHLNF